MLRNNEINIRDPFILTENGKYYMYGTRAASFGINVKGFDVYVSDDLENWSEPVECFDSEKNGMNKGKKVELLQPDCDHEPAAMVPFAGGYQLYYSCDKEEHGASYMGANAYYAIYNRDFELVSKDHKINTKTDKGILFYDVIQKEEGTNILYARDYLADCDLNIETID